MRGTVCWTPGVHGANGFGHLEGFYDTHQGKIIFVWNQNISGSSCMTGQWSLLYSVLA